MKKIILLILILHFTGCYYVEPVEPIPGDEIENSETSEEEKETIITLTGDVTFASLQYQKDQDLSMLLGKDIYTLTTYHGRNKKYPTTWSLYSYLPRLTGYYEKYKFKTSDNQDIEDTEKVSIYGEGQLIADERMRNLEEEILKNELPILRNSDPDYYITEEELDINHQRDFYVHAFDSYDSIYKRPMTLLGKTDNVYIYVDDSDHYKVEPYIESYLEYFDNLYPHMSEWFGEERDVDHNGKIIIVFSSTIRSSIIGYFTPADKFSGSIGSNSADMIYINAISEFQGDVAKITIAHEFQHMIFFDEKYRRGLSTSETWINEALSAAAEYLASEEFHIPAKYHKRWMSSGFLNKRWYELSLINWTSNNYGYGGIFMRYLIDHYGSEITKNVCNTHLDGISAIEEYTGLDFDIIFENFAKALVLSGRIDPSHPNYKPEYEFKTIDLVSEYDEAEDNIYNPIYKVGRLKETRSIDSHGGKSYIKPYYYSIYFTRWDIEFGYMTYTGVVGSSAFPQLELTTATVYAFTPGVF